MSATPLEKVLAMLPDHKRSGNGFIACCPAHEDHNPSLSITEGDDGRVLLHCHSQKCSFENICRALGLQVKDTMPDNLHGPGKRPTDKQTEEAVYSYCNAQGELIYQAIRYINPKTFRQRRPKEGGGWHLNLDGVKPLPYRLPELLAETEKPVFIVEGEKDVENLRRLGFVATSNSGGAGKWTAEHSAYLKGREVVIIPDNDEPGLKHAQQVASLSHGIAKSIRVIFLAGVPQKGDVSDWIAAGGNADELLAIVQAAQEWSPDDPLFNQPWPELLPLRDVPLPTFPTEVLPTTLRNWVEEESEATQTPPDMAAMLALAVIGAALAKRIFVLGTVAGWEETTNLFVVAIMGPGNRKSAVFADAIRPFEELEKELALAAGPDIAKLKSERRQKEIKLKRLENAGKPENRDEITALAIELDQFIVPAAPRLIVDDATEQKLEIMLGQQGGRIASFSPEGGVFDLMAGKYGKDGANQFTTYLKGHSGDPLRSDRVGRDSVFVDRPALTCGYAIQPQVLKQVSSIEAFRGRGLLARFFYSLPVSWVGDRNTKAQSMAFETRYAYSFLVQRLASITEERQLSLDAEATQVFLAWNDEIEAMLRDGGDLEAIRDWGSKLAGATLRIAGILHCVEDYDLPQISRRTIDAAITIARYLIPHAEVALLHMAATGGTNADAVYVLNWIERHKRNEFTKSEAQHDCKRRFQRSTDIDPALRILEESGYIRQVPSKPVRGRGRPGSPQYQVNPLALERKALTPREQYSQRRNAQVNLNNGNNGNGFRQSDEDDRGQVSL